MTTPEWLKPGIYGALLGAAFVGIFGFSWGGWMTASSAEEMANNMAQEDVIAALVPFCLDMARSDPARADKLATIRAASTFLIPVMLADQRRDAVMETGWATMPGTFAPNRDIAQACLEALDVDRSPERAENAVDER